MSSVTPSYFIRTAAHSYLPSEHTGGAWSTSEQHISPLLGLIVHTIEQATGANNNGTYEAGTGNNGTDDNDTDDKVISRLSFDILGVIGLEEFTIAVRTIRSGRTIDLIEAVASCNGRDIVICRAWRLSNVHTAHIAGGQPEALPSWRTLADWDLSSLWPGGYIASVAARPVGQPQPGHTRTWLSTPVQLLDGEATSDLARLMGLVDTANGIAVRVSTEEWLFPNVDLTIHLHGRPRGHWLGLDTTVTFGAEGQGVTSSILYDDSGAIGTAAQMLTVRPQKAR